MVMILIRLLGCVLFQLLHKPDLLVDGCPPCGNEQRHLEEAEGYLFPFLTLEVEEVLPYYRRSMRALHHTPVEGVLCVALLHVGDGPGRKWKPCLRAATRTYDLCISSSCLAFPLK